MIPGSASPLLLADSAEEAGYEIPRSLRFNSADSAYLNRTPSSAGNRKTWTWSGWVKRSNLGSFQTLFGSHESTSVDNNRLFLKFNTDDKLFIFEDISGSGIVYRTTDQVFRDASSWYHVVLSVDTTQSTADDRIKFYVNGEQITSFATNTAITQNRDTFVNSTFAHRIGSERNTGLADFDGYLADVHFIDGQALAPTDFGEYDDNNNWNPKEFTGTYGSNGFRLNFSDATSTTTIAEDSSGNNNDFTANNISVTAGSGNDSMFDAPVNGSQSDTGAGGEVSGNYCTMNPLALSDSSTNASVSLANGNLEVRNARTNYWGTALSTFSLSSGKWYFEASCIGSLSWSVGIYGVDPIASRFYTDDEAIGYSATGYEYKHTGVKQNNGSQSSYGASYSGGDVIGVALDLDGGTLTFYKNGTSQGTAFSSLSGKFALAVSCSGNNSGWNLNFGQRAFAYSAPSGYKALCTTNLPDPTIADGSTAMDVALYTGTGNSGQTVSGLNFSPDLVWFKSRSAAQNHAVFDTVRGVEKRLHPNLTQAEDDSSSGLTAFNSDGFTFGSNNVNGASSTTYVAWAWDGGTSTVSNTDGSSTSSVRANASAGFSIVTYTGNGSASATIGHGLNVKPGMVITKGRTATTQWIVYHQNLSGNAAGDNPWSLYLNGTDAQIDLTAFGAYSNITSSVIPVTRQSAATAHNNNSGVDYVAYCFAPVEGYSAFGSYTGNGSADGPFVFTNFRPALILLKNADATADWKIYDSTRDPDNAVDSQLYPSASYAESDGDRMDFLSNGFKLRTSGSEDNASGNTYIYAAFAEYPFKAARAR